MKPTSSWSTGRSPTHPAGCRSSKLLQEVRVPVLAVQIPLRSSADDVATAKRAIDAQAGPVVAVGSLRMAGRSITEAAAGRSQRDGVGLPLRRSSPEPGEPLAAFLGQHPVDLDSATVPDAAGFVSIDPARYPGGLRGRPTGPGGRRDGRRAESPSRAPSRASGPRPKAWHDWVPAWCLIARQDRATERRDPGAVLRAAGRRGYHRDRFEPTSRSSVTSPRASADHDRPREPPDARRASDREADRRRRPERRLRRSGPAERAGGDAAARLAVRHPQLRRGRARCSAAAGYRVIVPYLRGYGTTRFRRTTTVRNGSRRRWRVDAIALMDALGIRARDRRRLRLGRADRRHRRRAVARALQGAGVGERLPDRQPRGQQDAAAARGRARRGGTSSTSRPSAAGPATSGTGSDFARLIWQTRLAAVDLRRRHVRSQRRGLRQPRPRRHRHPQLPLAARPGRGRAAVRRR